MRLKKQKNGFCAMVKDVIIKCKKCGTKRNTTTCPRCPICKNPFVGKYFNKKNLIGIGKGLNMSYKGRIS